MTMTSCSSEGAARRSKDCHGLPHSGLEGGFQGWLVAAGVSLEAKGQESCLSTLNGPLELECQRKYVTQSVLRCVAGVQSNA